jgi:hypothetical protein
MREAVTAFCLEAVFLDAVIARSVNVVRECCSCILFVGHMYIIYLLKKKLRGKIKTADRG